MQAVLHLLSARVWEQTRAGDLTRRRRENATHLTVAGQRWIFTSFAASGRCSIVERFYHVRPGNPSGRQ